MTSAGEAPPYLVGLDLQGRRVTVIGAGHVLARRLETLLACRPLLLVVAPHADPAVEAAAAAGRLTWHRRGYLDGDLAGAWYAMAATDDPDVNARIVAESQHARIFCVRADDGSAGTAVTPATAREGIIQVGVVAGGDFRAARRWRDILAERLRAGADP